MPKRKGGHIKPALSAKELPPCEGPKLRVFKYQKARINWLERLDDTEKSESTTQGFVFKVEIQSQQYALKVFKFFDPSSTEYYWGPYLDGSLAADRIPYYTDPFYAECRAYGRIKEAREKRNLRRPVAIPCHGFLILGKRDRKILEERGIDLSAEGSDQDSLDRAKSSANHEIRAIVKDLAPPGSGLNSKTIRKVLKDIRLLNEEGIYNGDIRAENFRNGQLVDFGSAWTEPHRILEALDVRNPEESRDTRLQDLIMFDTMIEQEGIRTKIRAVPNFEYCEKLRSGGQIWR